MTEDYSNILEMHWKKKKKKEVHWSLDFGI